MTQALGSVLALAGARGTRVLIMLATAALLARLIGPEGLGRWYLIVAAATLLHSLLLNWTQAILVRFGTEERSAGGRLDGTYAMRVPFLLAGFAVAFALLWQEPLGWGRLFGLDVSGRWLAAAYLVGLWLGAELQSLMAVQGRYGQLAFVPTVAEAVTVAVLYVLMLTASASPTLVVAVIPAAATLVIGSAVLKEWRRLRVRRRTIAWAQLTAAMAFAWPLIPNFAIGYVSEWADHLVLRQYTSIETVGVFQAAYQMMLLLASLSVPVATVLLPHLIQLSSSDSTAGRRYVERLIPAVVILWLPLVATATALAPAMVQWLYGSRFTDAGPIVSILCIAVPGTIFTSLYGVLFSVQRRLHAVTKYHGVMASVNLALSLLLVPSIGAMGAAISTAVSYLLVQRLYMRNQHAHLGVTDRSAVLLHGLAIAFSIAQSMIAGHVAGRLALALGLTVAVVVVARVRGLVDVSILERLLGSRLSWAVPVLTRVLGGAAR